MFQFLTKRKLVFFFVFVLAGLAVSLSIYTLSPRKYSAELVLVSIPTQIQWLGPQRDKPTVSPNQPVPDLAVILSSNLVSLELQNLVSGPVALVVNKRSGDSSTYQITIISDSIEHSVRAAERVDQVLLKIMETYLGRDTSETSGVIAAIDSQISTYYKKLQRSAREGGGVDISTLDLIAELQSRKQVVKSPVKLRVLGVTPNLSPYSHNLFNSILYGFFGGAIAFFAMVTILAWAPALKNYGDTETHKT
jgi:hypothetical protein